MRVRALSALLLLTLAESAAGQSGGLVPVGIVARLKGSWIRPKDGKTLQVGDEVYRVTSVATEASTSNTIKVAFFDGTSWELACSQAKPCAGGQPFGIKAPPDNVADNRGFKAFLTTYFSSPAKPVPPVFMASRSLSESGPGECVLEARNGVIDLSPCLVSVPPGRLAVLLASSDDAGMQEKAALDWPSQRTVPAVSPGSRMLAVSLENAAGEKLGRPAAALLVTGPEPAARAREEFERAQSIAKQWQDVDASAVRLFLIRSLYAIQSKIN